MVAAACGAGWRRSTCWPRTTPGWASSTSPAGWGSTRARRRGRCARSPTTASPSATPPPAPTASARASSPTRRASPSAGSCALAPAVLERLVRELGERAHLSVLDGTEVLTLHSHSPPHAVQAAGWAGRTVPAYCTAAGRALLADHDADALRALLEGVELAPPRRQHEHQHRGAGRADPRDRRARLRGRRRGVRARSRRRRRARSRLRRPHRRGDQRLGAVVPLRPAAARGRTARGTRCGGAVGGCRSSNRSC